MEKSSALGALSALSQDTRLRIFRLLVEHGADGIAAGDIGRKLDLPPATLSFHIKELAVAGLVAARPRGRFIHYSADFAVMRGLVAYLAENCCRADSPGDVGSAGRTVDCASDVSAGRRPASIPKPKVRPKKRVA